MSTPPNTLHSRHKPVIDCDSRVALRRFLEGHDSLEWPESGTIIDEEGLNTLLLSGVALFRSMQGNGRTEAKEPLDETAAESEFVKTVQNIIEVEFEEPKGFQITDANTTKRILEIIAFAALDMDLLPPNSEILKGLKSQSASAA